MASATVAYAAATKLVPHPLTSFTWRVEGLSAPRIEGADRYAPLRSPTFDVGDDKCCLELYPAGNPYARVVAGSGVLIWPGAPDSALICMHSLITAPHTIMNLKYDVTLAAAGRKGPRHPHI
jgi:hypothetical protein